MKLALITDHRFKHDASGELSSPLNYDYSYFAERYLPSFDGVTVLARVEQSDMDHIPLGPSVAVQSLGSWTGLFQFLASKQQISRVLSPFLDGRYAVIMTVPSAVSTIAYGMLKKRGVPYGVEVIGDPYDVFSRNAYRHPLRVVIQRASAEMLRRQCRDAKASRYVTAAALQQRYPPHPGTFSISCSNVVLPDEAFAPEPRRFTRKARWRLIHVGTMAQPYKAQDVLLRAVAKCVSKGLEVELVLIGDGRYRTTYEKLVHQLELQERIRFLGQLAPGCAIREQLCWADLFVLPSRTEGLPRALIEAMAQALPCLGTNVGGIGELLASEHRVDVNDSNGLSSRIIELLKNPHSLATASARNLEVAREYHERKLADRRTQFCRIVREECERVLVKRAA